MRKVKEPFSTPIVAPPYGPQPWYGHHYEAVSVEFETKEEEMLNLLPDIPGLELGPRRTVIASIRPHYEPIHAGYRMAGSIWFTVKYKDMIASMHYIAFTSEDKVLMADRELLGYPHYMCDSGRLNYEGGVWGEIRRRGQMVMRIGVHIEEMAELKEGLSIRKPNILFYKKIPNADSKGPPLRQLVLLARSSVTKPLKPFKSWEAYVGRGILEFGMTEFNLHRLQPTKIVKGYYSKMEGGLTQVGPCKIIWEDESFYEYHRKRVKKVSV